uniref:NADH dehydrogenase [ubiquinone] 1 alpha subcomplex subunit 13 n=1 Tax=Pinguiococcus pyrenoidosus TaxID=172671 RepID=A0A7R9U1N8_9STRA|mmetsp:Transcript_10054/g.38068  ORF Transcript_10054/g.38068 Transcript_10054/m.38068 type:complete len:141 (+) Transcript_10054:157-579(+)
MGGPPSFETGRARNRAPIRQEMPPPGGFPSIITKNMNRNRGPSGVVIFSVYFLVTAYGFYLLGEGNRKRRRVKEETRNMRIALAPMLQFEADVAFLKQREEDLKKEAEVMKDVPGWEVGAPLYKTNVKWMPPLGRIKWDQ